MAGGVKEKGEGLGRELIPKRNKEAAASMGRGEACSPQASSLLRSMSHDAVLQRAAEADQLAEAASDSDLVRDLDGTAEMEQDRRRLRREQEALHASSLRVPRRPRDSHMTREEYIVNERWAFLVWRKNLGRLEENDNLVLTPFEKNIDGKCLKAVIYWLQWLMLAILCSIAALISRHMQRKLTSTREQCSLLTRLICCR